jgi:hypothetical protein
VIGLDEDAEDERVIALQSLSNAQLIEILQRHDGDDDLAQMVEEELTRRKTDGAPPQRSASTGTLDGWLRINRCGNRVSVQ